MEENKQEKKVVNEVFTKEDIDKNKTMAILAYIIWPVPFFAAKDSKFAMYHAKQGLVLFLFWLAGWVVLQVLWNIMTWSMIGFIGLLSTALWVAYLVFAIIGIINVSNGKAQELPVIGGLAKKF